MAHILNGEARGNLLVAKLVTLCVSNWLAVCDQCDSALHVVEASYPVEDDLLHLLHRLGLDFDYDVVDAV